MAGGGRPHLRGTLPSNMYSTLSPEDKMIWGKLSPEGRAMIIKRINDGAKSSVSNNDRVSSVHERVEVNTSSISKTSPQADGEDGVHEYISERNHSPGQLELQRQVALAQSKREVKQHDIMDDQDPPREVRK